MAKDKLPTILVRWEGNQSKRYDNTVDEIWLSSVVAINKTAVVQPSLAQVHVGDIIEYEFVAKKGKAVQLWRGIVVSIDPDAERRAGSRSKKADTTTKGASRLSATVPDMERRATESLFEGLGSNKGKRKKRLSSSPLPSARPLPKRKRGVGLPPSQDRIDGISGELRDITKAPSLGVGLPSLSSLKTIAIQLGEIKETNELSRHSQEQLKHSLEQSQHSLRHSLYLQEIQSLELQEMKASLLSLERTVKKLSEKSEEGLPNDDVIDVDSLSSFSSNPPPTESSGSLSLPPAFGSPPPSYSGNLTSPGYYPRIPSFSGKRMRASSAPPTYRYFQQDYNDASFFSENNYPQSAGLLELECGEPLPPSNTPSDEVIPSRNAADFGTLHQNEMPSRGASPTPCQSKFIPTKCKSSDEVLSIYSFYKNTKDIGKLAIALAKYTYFGPQEMSQCTVMGQGNTKPLDPNKLKRLRENIRSVFPMVDDDEFKAIWDKCKESIAGVCKALRASIRYL